MRFAQHIHDDPFMHWLYSPLAAAPLEACPGERRDVLRWHADLLQPGPGVAHARVPKVLPEWHQGQAAEGRYAQLPPAWACHMTPKAMVQVQRMAPCDLCMSEAARSQMELRT